INSKCLDSDDYFIVIIFCSFLRR
ncbi:hypothetical protein A5865_000508, partial [Enterococcus sp. 12E11_DIV0728]